MRKFIYLFFLLLASCNVPSKMAIKGSGGRCDYNVVIQQTNAEEMLLNLVRLRYFDAPYFLEVSNITTQYTYKTTAKPSFTIPGFSKDRPVHMEGEWVWQNQPTIQYMPLQGYKFATQLMMPIDLGIIQRLIYAGWDIDRLFRLVIEGFSDLINSPLGSGPVYESDFQYKPFYEVTKLLRHFQKNRQLQVGVRLADGMNGNKEEMLQIFFPSDSEEAKTLAGLIKGIKRDNGKYMLNLHQGYTTKDYLGILPRSLLSCMYYLSLGVRVPKVDVQTNRVAMPELTENEYKEYQEIITNLIEIQCASSRPCGAYCSVKYRGTWFYISDSDLKSKRTFILLQQLYNLQEAEEKSSPPLLTLPVG